MVVVSQLLAYELTAVRFSSSNLLKMLIEMRQYEILQPPIWIGKKDLRDLLEYLSYLNFAQVKIPQTFFLIGLLNFSPKNIYWHFIHLIFTNN